MIIGVFTDAPIFMLMSNCGVASVELTPPKSLSSLRQERFNSRGLNCKAMLQIDKLAGACTRDSISICNDVDFINKALER